MMSRLFAFGDIHGCLAPLQALLAMINPQYDDELFFLGDYVDRGRESSAVLDCLIDVKQQHNARFILGNHEEMMLMSRDDEHALRTWCRVGGYETLDSYGAGYNLQGLQSVLTEHWDFLERCEAYIETDHYIFTHAAIDAGLSLAKQSVEALRWQKRHPSEPHHSEKIVVHGHHSRDHLWVDNNYICIDTHCYGGGWLTCLEIDNGSYRVLQANNLGETRSLALRSLLNKEGVLYALIDPEGQDV